VENSLTYDRRDKEAVMIHIGTVHVNGREYSLDLNRAPEPRNDCRPEAGNTPTRRNFPTSRSEILLLNPNRKTAGPHHSTRPSATVRKRRSLR
jgi:hypothetical protein